ncbi:DUF3575 domain-containing protein [Aggregatimonas sangjinii]|uniref:DUF3575 domain-containing protein n=1 Tax=Aggregatimonas sangjinii TaxID=2583587 RepID=UPI0015866C84|nr:DUF3575 domain-containing protein [Aggregatimonas sangjinii]
MKKSILSFCLIASLGVGQAQDVDPSQDRNELKVNVSNLIALAFADVAYERLLNEESSVGIAILSNINQSSDNDFLDAYREFSITPYYRQYFSRGYAKGFFVEGFGMYNTGDDRDFFGDDIISDTTYADFALGVSVGGKFVTRRGFMVEVYGGLGRNLLNADFSPSVVGRGGVSLGYRF